MLRLLAALMLLLAGLAFVTPTASAAACSTDPNFTDDDGVSATCAVPRTGMTCTAGALAYGDPTPSVSCRPWPIVCVTEPCP